MNKETHYVPLEVLDRYWKSFEIPFKEEGWDEIVLHNDVEFDEDIVTGIFNQMLDFNQDNPNHTLTLGKHSGLVFKWILNDKNGCEFGNGSTAP